jgi:PAS domain S-box-containing protein
MHAALLPLGCLTVSHPPESVVSPEPSCLVLPLGTVDLGLSLLRAQRARGYGGAIVFYVASALREVIASAIAAGAQDVLLPATESRESIQRAITHAVMRQRVTSAVPEATPRQWIYDRFMEAQALASVGSWEVHVPTWTVEWSPEFRRIMGIGLNEPPPELEGYAQRVHAEDRQRVTHELLELFQKGQGFVSDHRVVHPDGKELHVKAIGSCERASDGSVLRAYGTTQDITLFVKAQQAQAELVKKLQSALDEVKVLTGLLPICMYCKKIRDEQGTWQGLESYLHARTAAQFSHGICTACMRLHHPDAS